MSDWLRVTRLSRAKESSHGNPFIIPSPNALGWHLAAGPSPPNDGERDARAHQPNHAPDAKSKHWYTTKIDIGTQLKLICV